MGAIIKPEIYISLIPTGRIYLKPVLFATIIPTPQIITADSLRKVVLSELIGADSLRQVQISENFSADTLRQIITYVGVESTSADTYLQIVTNNQAIADLNRSLREIICFDTCRQVTRKEKAIASTLIRIPFIMKYNVYGGLDIITFDEDNLPTQPVTLMETFKEYGVTEFNVTLRERTLSDEFKINVAYPLEIGAAVEGDLLDYRFSFLVEETSQSGLIQAIKGMYNQDELLYTQFFLDTYENAKGQEYVVEKTATKYVKEIAEALGLNEECLFDDFIPYNLNGRTRITYIDLIQSLFGWTARVPQRQINVFIRGNTLHAIQRGREAKKGSTLFGDDAVVSVFDITELSHSRPTINRKLIRTLWNNPKAADNDNDPNKPDDSNDPTVDYQYEEKINLFSGTITFSDEGCSTSLRYSKGLLMRETNESWNAKATLSSSVSYDYIEIFPNMSDLEVTIKKAFDKNFFGEFYLAQKKLSSSATIKEEDEYKKTEQYGKTNYRYDETDKSEEVYLRSEVESTTTITYETNENGLWVQTDEKEDVRETYYVPIGNGWYGQSVYQNGMAQGANISQGKPGNRITQQTMGEVQKILSGWTITYTPNENDDDSDNDDDGDDDDETPEEQYEDWRNKLAPIVDISFPVKDLNLLETLTDDLLSLNRAIEETLSVDLISKVVNGVPEINHIVDFTERIKLDGAEYFLVSNTISFTPRKLIQKLQLIRWI